MGGDSASRRHDRSLCHGRERQCCHRDLWRDRARRGHDQRLRRQSQRCQLPRCRVRRLRRPGGWHAGLGRLYIDLGASGIGHDRPGRPHPQRRRGRDRHHGLARRYRYQRPERLRGCGGLLRLVRAAFESPRQHFQYLGHGVDQVRPRYPVGRCQPRLARQYPSQRRHAFALRGQCHSDVR